MPGKLNTRFVSDFDSAAPERIRAARLELRERIRSRNARSSPDGARHNSPLVSVIVLNINGAALLPRCLGCLLAQTYRNFEIIVVDNGSTDSSIEVLRPYLSDGRVRLAESGKNLGIAGGRNFGARLARGEAIVFIDNDGYAAYDWLEELVKALYASDDVGAAASLVFFAKNELVLNGAGGTRNAEWRAGDLCFNEPYEFALLPREVLYPMGCGMAIKRDTFDAIGPLDEYGSRYYDDVEVGLRTWRTGRRVVLARDAHVDHEFHFSHRTVRTRGWLRAFHYERMRVRTALKYATVSERGHWRGLERKYFIRTLKEHRRHAAVLVLGYLWNLAHLPSALRVRRKFAGGPAVPDSLTDASTGIFPPPAPRNEQFPTIGGFGSQLRASTAEGDGRLHYGWYSAEDVAGKSALWSNGSSAAFLGSTSGAKHLRGTFFTSVPLAVRIQIRDLGREHARVESSFVSTGAWETFELPAALPYGPYEILFRSDVTLDEASGRRLGLALAELEFS